MPKLIVALACVASFMLVGCTFTVPISTVALSPTPRAATPSSLTSGSTSFPPSLTPHPSPTPSVAPTAQPTFTPTPSATRTLKPIVRQQRLDIETGLPPDHGITGTLVLSGPDDGYLLDLQTLMEYILPRLPNSGMGIYDWITVSPNGKWFAYTVWFTEPFVRQLQIVDAEGQQLHISGQGDWEHVIGWLDDERLALTKKNHPDGTVIVFRPLTGEWQELEPTFPPMLPDRPGGIPIGLTYWHASNSPFVIYDPMLTRVAYMRNLDVSTYVLWDIQSSKIVWEMPTGLFDPRPVWSPDGDHFAVALDPDSAQDFASLYMVDRDGQETWLTDMVAGSLTWSPDGRYIACWWAAPLEFGDHGGGALTIVDVKNRDVTIYSLYAAISSQYPIWSPDGQYVAMDSAISDTETRVIIVDIDQNRAFEVVRDVKVRGWMTAAP